MVRDIDEARRQVDALRVFLSRTLESAYNADEIDVVRHARDARAHAGKLLDKLDELQEALDDMDEDES
jgi:hypothetical protein